MAKVQQIAGELDPSEMFRELFAPAFPHFAKSFDAAVFDRVVARWRLTDALKRLGWTKGARRKVGGVTLWPWLPPAREIGTEVGTAPQVDPRQREERILHLQLATVGLRRWEAEAIVDRERAEGG